MSYASDVIFHIPFDSEPIVNAVSTQFLTSSTTPVIVDGVFGNAWQMPNNDYLLSNDTISPTNKLTIGFWLKPVNPGIVTDPVSTTSKPLKMPVLSKATFNVSGFNSIVSYTFLLWEETQNDGTNILKAKVKGIKNSALAEATITSTPYQVGIFHHFWIIYDGAVDSLRLFVDTMEELGGVSGTVPSTLSINASNLTINNNVDGPLWQVTRNQGDIDDLVIFSSAKSDPNTITRAANKGALYVADNVYTVVDEIDHAIVFDDPGTAQITSVYSNRGRLYVARSDGKLLRGTKLLWETRREFSNDKEIDGLTAVNKGDSGLIRVSLGSLKIQNKVVRV